ncbi:MAG TPA: MerR family transcriptional regulator [Humibacter sp.]|nr:MerR family transcriptional regulator [Humibacter sp.]
MTDDTDAADTDATAAAEHERSIQQLARLTGTTSRTLRHYDDIGLLKPSRIGQNGYRYYDGDALVRLQRILLLRELGLGLPAIAEVLERQTDAVPALQHHLSWLRAERERLARQAASVASTIDALQRGEPIMAETAFDGFDHTQYKEEVEERWGKDAYAKSDAWWRGMSDAERAQWQQRQQSLSDDWKDAAARGLDPAGDEAQVLAARQAKWLGGVPETPGSKDGRPTKEYFIGLGEMYVADERFAAHYGGAESAAFVRDAMRVYAESNL